MNLNIDVIELISYLITMYFNPWLGDKVWLDLYCYFVYHSCFLFFPSVQSMLSSGITMMQISFIVTNTAGISTALTGSSRHSLQMVTHLWLKLIFQPIFPHTMSYSSLPDGTGVEGTTQKLLRLSMIFSSTTLTAVMVSTSKELILGTATLAPLFIICLAAVTMMTVRHQGMSSM